MSLAEFLCPSDTDPGGSAWSGGANMRVNLGSERWPTLDDAPTNGPVMSYRCSPPSATSDGLSNTALISEKLRGHAGASAFDPRTDMAGGALGLPYGLDESIAHCRLRRRSAAYYGQAGLVWGVGTLSQTCYNHAIGPNTPMSDCVIALGNPVSGIIAARSNHPGGVNLTMADGSVRFVSDSIRLETWRALGTRASGDSASAGY